MRKLVKMTTVVSILFLGWMSNASNVNPKPTHHVLAVDEEKFIVTVDASSGDVNIVLKDIYGVSVYSAHLEQGYVYKKTYVLTELPAGVYYMRIKDKDFTKVYEVDRGAINLVVAIENDGVYKKKEQLLALMM